MLSDEQINHHLDAILKASGSALRHYTMSGTLDAMRSAVRAVAEAERDRILREMCGQAGDGLRNVLGQLDPSGAAAGAPAGFYLASFKRKSHDGKVIWWGPNDNDYTPYLEQAGIYTAKQIAAHPDYYDNDYTVPVPAALVAGHTASVIDQEHNNNRAFWDAKSLRELIAASTRI